MRYTPLLFALVIIFLISQWVLTHSANKDLKKQILELGQLHEQEQALAEQQCSTKLTELRDYIQFMALQDSNADYPAPVLSDNVKTPSVDFYEVRDHQIQRTILLKYAILLDSLALPADAMNQLTQLLVEREKIMSSGGVVALSDNEVADYIDRKQQSLRDIDLNIQTMLSDSEMATFDLLKDSAYEQVQLNSFFDALPDGENLGQSIRRELVIHKLETRQRFFTDLAGLGEQIKTSDGDIKNQLIEQLRESLHAYKDDYLTLARSLLSETQFAELREVEQKTANEMWQSLLAGWEVETLSN